MKHIIVVFVVACLLFSAQVKVEAQYAPVKVKYNYLAFVPENYDSLKSELLPVIFYLHGSSVCGTNINRVKSYGLPYFLDKGKKLDFIVIAPQCPKGKNWASDNWFDTIYSEVCSKYRIDTTKVYLTGMSLGGFGTWELANRYPHRFAAIAPLCGGGKTEWAENLSQLPIWVFHGIKDALVPVTRSDQMVSALKKLKSLVVYSRLPDKGHDINRVYNDDRLYSWFNQFSIRPSNEQDALSPIKSIPVAGLLNPEQPIEELKPPNKPDAG